jgi:glycosyltransferase involved in cell wall biosynthesis
VTVDVSVVIPFFDEEESAPPLLAELRPVLDRLGRPYEVLVVNDGSRDATGEALRVAAAGWPEARVLELARNQGQASALLCGLHAARGGVLVTLDGDGQNDPADIPALLARLEGADLVAGVRAQRHDSPLRRSMSRIANAVRARFLGDGLRDSGCALKAFRREVLDCLLPIRTLYSFIPALAVGAGFRVVEAPVAHRERERGRSKYGLRVMLWRPAVDMLGVKWFLSRRVPARPPLAAAQDPPSARRVAGAAERAHGR